MKNSIEEDIKIVESIIEEYESCSVPEMNMQVDVTFRKEQNNALKHILSDYKKLKDEFKAVDSECNRLERKEVEREKIIDLMAEHITSSAIVDDTVCAIKCDCEDGIDCSHEKALKCTKQYFKNKAKEVISND